MVASKYEEKAMISRGLQEFLHRPDVVRESSLHRRRHAESLMYAAEVKKSHVEVNGGGQMFQRFAESQAQARKAAQVRSHAQVGAFDVRSADVCFIRVSGDNYRN